jgi:cytochrome c5
MKLKVCALAFLAVLMYSCGSNPPKTQVSTTKPDPVQVPPKMESPNESPTMSEVVSEGKILYDNKCGTCHKLFAPSDYSKQDWPPILLRMQIKARINDADMAKINSYVYANL